MQLQFKVIGDPPPKKDGAQSMWGKPTEARRLERLRLAAKEAIQNNQPLRQNIKLSLKIHLGIINDQFAGDLDNYITGICDGLMAANPMSKLVERWSNPDLTDIHPSKTIAIVDDSQVVCIHAEKIIGEVQQSWYEIILEGDA